jgi:hypothetical protein
MSPKNAPPKIKYPYARLTGMKEFMAFVQEPGWQPIKVDVGLMKKLAIAKGKEREAINALLFLGIINENGVPTEMFNELKSEYQITFRRIVHDEYGELFNIIPARMAN